MNKGLQASPASLWGHAATALGQAAGHVGRYLDDPHGGDN